MDNFCINAGLWFNALTTDLSVLDINQILMKLTWKKLANRDYRNYLI